MASGRGQCRIACLINPSVIVLAISLHSLDSRVIGDVKVPTALLQRSSTKAFSRLTLCASSSAASISPHWDSLLLLLHVLEVLKSALKFPTIDGLGGFAGVLE